KTTTSSSRKRCTRIRASTSPTRSSSPCLTPSKSTQVSARMFRLQELVDRLGGELHGDGNVTVARVATLEKAGEGELAFLANRKYLSQVSGCAASALIV